MSFRTLVAAVVLASGCVLPAAAQQQPAPPQLPAVPDAAAISAPQIQRWFEAFTVLQAQEALELSETQYGRFVTRLKALQESRRKHQQARNQVLADLRKLTHPKAGTNDDAQLADRLKALRDADERGAADLKRA